MSAVGYLIAGKFCLDKTPKSPDVLGRKKKRKANSVHKKFLRFQLNS